MYQCFVRHKDSFEWLVVEVSHLFEHSLVIECGFYEENADARQQKPGVVVDSQKQPEFDRLLVKFNSDSDCIHNSDVIIPLEAGKHGLRCADQPFCALLRSALGLYDIHLM